MLIKTSSLVASLVLMLGAGCASEVGPDESGPGEGGGGGEGGEDVNSVTRVAGNYELISVYNIAENSELPPLVSDVVVPLSSLAENPTGTIIDLVQASNTPIAGVINAIPGPLLSIFESTMNSLIQNKLYDNYPVLEQVAFYGDLVAGMLVEFEVVTELQVQEADEVGNANATHTLVGVAFKNGGTRTFINTPELLDSTTLAQNVSVNVDLAGSLGSIDIGDHGMRLPLGEFAVYGLNATIAATSDFEDLGDALAGILNCEGLAADIGDLCISFVCVADESQLQGICETGLDLVAQQVESRIRGLDVSELRLSGGQADVTATAKEDSTRDKEINAFKAGKWDAVFTFGTKALPTRASFEATRI